MHVYEEKIKIFRRDIMPPVHINSGQPARGTKFIIIQYKNKANRNI
jgi:hypothetical protein